MPDIDHDSADAGIADQNSTPTTTITPEPAAPQTGNAAIAAGIADENAIPDEQASTLP